MDNKTIDNPVKTDKTSSSEGVGTNPSVFNQIAEKIIAQQETIIGPIAVEQAKRIKQLEIDWTKHEINISGNPQAAIDGLVEQYKELFGQIAVETCKEAAARFISQLSPEQLPHSLK